MKNTGGPAFPQAHDDSGWPGMTLRDYFAAKAMQGMLADRKQVMSPSEWAANAYRMADAMLAERIKT